MKRIKKPAVTPEQDQDWLRRNQQGESAAQIADKDGYDKRTVEVHLEHARQEIEAKEMRRSVLRDAVESHYQDMCAVAEKLNPQSPVKDKYLSPKEEHIKIALRKHLPRSPIWENLSKLDGIQKTINDINDRIEKRIAGLKSDPQLRPFGNRVPAIMSGVDAFFKHQTEQWAQGYHGLDLDLNEIQERSSKLGFVNYGVGFSRMGEMDSTEIPIMRLMLKKWQKRVRQWPEYLELEKAHSELKRVEKNLAEDLWAITLRRVLPGRCDYCPI
ncbi:MAG: hypothetical protein P3T54_01775 [Dehalogenimonas sp.]|uniref:HTH luxR-type domain-containing protein n=1 Tax=Candidatus Dehalogenimonas loeffleri TaxID=3127115 RepID=A0ABZ2J5E2_9CHLR|nr:hypothetical protein [Dehalogenimonas sp.]